MLLRFRRHNTADQGSDEASERPRRGIDTGNHYEFFGGTVTIGVRPAAFCLRLPAVTFACRILYAAPLHVVLSQSRDVRCCMCFTPVMQIVTAMLRTAGPDWKSFLASLVVLVLPSGAGRSALCRHPA